MSALDQRRTLFTASLYVRFTPKSGHAHRRHRCPAEADAPILAAYWMIAPRYGSITAPLSEQTT